MVLKLSRLALEVVLSDRNILLTGVTNFLAGAVITSDDSDALGVPLLPLLSTLDAFLSALDGGFGR
jgi:hypothetical protein